MACTLAENATASVSMMLNHGAQLEHCMLALSYRVCGFLFVGRGLGSRRRASD